MGRPRKFVNTSIYPDNVIETVARVFYDDLVAEAVVYEEDVQLLPPDILETADEISQHTIN